jgi:hypothetical protein
MFESMASFMSVEHANGAMFDPRCGVAARQHISAGAAPCLLLMRSART